MSSLFQKIWNIIIFLIGSLITTWFFSFVFTIFYTCYESPSLPSQNVGFRAGTAPALPTPSPPDAAHR